MVGLQGITGIGPVALRALIEHFGSAEEIFRQSPRTLEMIKGVGEVLRDAVEDPATLTRAEKELDFVDKLHIKVVTIPDDDYPRRLRECPDAPYLLFVKGSGDLNPKKAVSIVGTRKASKYGRMATERVVEELSAHGVTVNSGLAYGIDSCAHKAALDKGLETFAVLAHGLDRIYPKQNNRLAYEMRERGGLITELMRGVPPDKDQFPRRNRIIAGLSDAVIVVESAKKGGSLVSAKLGRHYDREVFAVPGRIDDAQSAGCLSLIAQHLAIPYVDGDQFADEMGWSRKGSVDRHRPKEEERVMPEVDPDLQPMVKVLFEKGQMHFDDLAMAADLDPADLSVKLFDLEVKGIVRSLPGKKISLVR